MDELANTMRHAPVRSIAVRTFAVPSMLIARSAGSPKCASIAHAQWATTSQPSIARVTASTSRMSAGTNRDWG